MSYGTPTDFDAVPRGGSAHNELGGFQIDQNNGNPTSGLALSTSAGLCTLCHGTDVDAMDIAAGKGNGGNEGLWVGTNGHSNAALGGTSSAEADILSLAERNPSVTNTPPVTDVTGNWQLAGTPDMGYASALENSTSHRADGFRSTYNKSYGWTNILPDVSAIYAYNAFDWGLTQDTGTVDTGYHAFTCSKCHNPHASRLPKLMITNCLDTRQNTWDNDGQTPSGPSEGQGEPLGADSAGKTKSNLTSAQNCHRLGDAGQSGTGSGWNNVTPQPQM